MKFVNPIKVKQDCTPYAFHKAAMTLWHRYTKQGFKSGDITTYISTHATIKGDTIAIGGWGKAFYTLQMWDTNYRMSFDKSGSDPNSLLIALSTHIQKGGGE